jgi:hypothetical protein
VHLPSWHQQPQQRTLCRSSLNTKWPAPVPLTANLTSHWAISPMYQHSPTIFDPNLPLPIVSAVQLPCSCWAMMLLGVGTMHSHEAAAPLITAPRPLSLEAPWPWSAPARARQAVSSATHATQASNATTRCTPPPPTHTHTLVCCTGSRSHTSPPHITATRPQPSGQSRGLRTAHLSLLRRIPPQPHDQLHRGGTQAHHTKACMLHKGRHTTLRQACSWRMRHMTSPAMPPPSALSYLPRLQPRNAPSTPKV